MIVSDKYLNVLFRTVVGSRAGWRCEGEVCGHVGDDCQAHHIYSRDNKSVRYDPLNGAWLCNYHHRLAEIMGTKDFIVYLYNTKKRPEGWREELITRKNQIVKANNSYREYWKEKLLSMLKEAA